MNLEYCKNRRNNHQVPEQKNKRKENLNKRIKEKNYLRTSEK